MSNEEDAGEAIMGRCPECEAGIPAQRLLARYVSPSGPARVLAECPECAAIVAPA